jgi:hypothetical protein
LRIIGLRLPAGKRVRVIELMNVLCLFQP